MSGLQNFAGGAVPSHLLPGPGANPQEAVLKMNQTLAMMRAQPEIVCQLFGAFTAGGVMPDLQTYDMVVRACVQQGLFECAEMLLSAAETQGLQYQGLLYPCLESNVSDNAFILRWAPKALEANLTIPHRCFKVLFRDRAAVGGVKMAVALFKLLMRVGSPEDKAAEALVQSVAELQKLMQLQEVMKAMGCPNQRVAGLIEKLAVKTKRAAEEQENQENQENTSPNAAMGMMLSPPTVILPVEEAASSSDGEMKTLLEVAMDEDFMPPPGLDRPPMSPSESPSPDPADTEAVQAKAMMLESSEAHDAQGALRVLQDMKTADQHISYSLYLRVIKVCVASGALQDAQVVLEEMRQVYSVDVTVYNVILKSHASKGRFDKAEKTLEEMKRLEVEPDDVTYNALLDAAARTGRHEKGWHLLATMMKLGITADKYSVSLLLKNVTDKMDKHKVKRGIELVEKYIEMQREDADDILFNSLLDACCRVKDVTRLERTLQKMRQFDVKPSPATFGTLLKAYGQKNDVNSVARVWNDMKTADVGMNTVTYGCMLDACVKCGNYEKAEDVFAEMKVVGMHRNTILYTTMIKSYSKQKKLRRALKLAEEMKTEGVPLNCVTYNSLIDAAIRCRDLPAATKLLEQMKEQGIVPDLITYSTLIKGFCDQGNIHVAVSLLTRLKQQAMKCDEILYNSLLEGTVKASEVSLGVKLFQEMVVDKVPMSNITFSIMVKLYAQAGRLDQAMDLVQRMDPEFKVKPTNVVFACLVKCCIGSHRVQQAAQLLLGLPRAVKVQPDQQMYAAVLPGLVQQGALDMALDILEALCAAPYAAEGAVTRQLNLFPLAQSLFDAVGNSVLLKEKARNLMDSVSATQLLSQEQERQLSAMLGPKTQWGGEEFVPGQAFNADSASWAPKEFTPGMLWDEQAYADMASMEGWTAYADPSYYAGWEENWAADQITPPRFQKGKGSDENASPNVMQILLQTDVGTGEKVARRGKKGGTPVKSPPKRMAPTVTSTTPPTGPLEFSVPAQSTVVGVLTEQEAK
jgi:pentatricopeptide repeat protein